MALVIGVLAWWAITTQRIAEEQLARNHWEQSRIARQRGESLTALHFVAEAIRLAPQLKDTLLLDVRDIQPNLLVGMFAHQGPVDGAQFSRDESRILTWSDDNTARLWDARTGKPIGPALQHQGAVRGAQFSRDESRILTWSYDNTARLWDARTGKPIGPALQHRALFTARSSAGTRAASSPGVMTKRCGCGMRGRARRWARRWSTRACHGAQFSRDESRILTWSDDKTARLWDARTGQAIGPALEHQGVVRGAQFSRDESRILTWSDDNTVRLWDARTGQAIGPAMQHQDLFNGAQFSRDESRILTWSDDRTARLWERGRGRRSARRWSIRAGSSARSSAGTRAASYLE